MLRSVPEWDTRWTQFPSAGSGPCGHYRTKLVGRNGIEPPTPGLSVLEHKDSKCAEILTVQSRTDLVVIRWTPQQSGMRSSRAHFGHNLTNLIAPSTRASSSPPPPGPNQNRMSISRSCARDIWSRAFDDSPARGHKCPTSRWQRSRLGSVTRSLCPLPKVVAAGIVHTVNVARFPTDCASCCDEEHGFESQRDSCGGGPRSHLRNSRRGHSLLANTAPTGFDRFGLTVPIRGVLRLAA
jgi:hypothetical protein